MKSLLDLIKLLYGPKELSSTLGTRTNVISLANKKFEKYIKGPLNIEEASDEAAINAYKEMEKIIVDVPKMNDAERLIFEGNLRRTKNKLQSMGLIPPDKTAEIVSMGTKEPVSKEGIEQLIEEAGQTSPPGTLMGDLESRINKLKAISKEQGMTTEDALGDFAKSQTSMINQQREGLVRSTVRQILYSDIKSGKLKVSKEIEDIVMGRASGDPIDTFRNIYGEDALEQVDSLTSEIGKLRTEIEAEKLARSKFEFTPKLNRPKESYTEEELKAILDKEPKDEFAGGGSVGLDYLMGMSTGGRVSYAEGTRETPSITLDSHNKAPENEDKYPIKVGENLELNVKGRMTSGSNTPDRYTKIKTDERDFSVRGKLNVPGTPLSLTGGIGDIRFKENVDFNVPEYNYKENIKNVMKVNPSSIGAEYKLGPNSLISGSRDSIDGRNTYNLGYKYGPVSIDYRDSPQGKDVMAKFKTYFSQGGLGYLMGE